MKKIRINKKTIIYILAPSRTSTGGPGVYINLDNISKKYLV